MPHNIRQCENQVIAPQNVSKAETSTGNFCANSNSLRELCNVEFYKLYACAFFTESSSVS